MSKRLSKFSLAVLILLGLVVLAACSDGKTSDNAEKEGEGSSDEPLTLTFFNADGGEEKNV